MKNKGEFILIICSLLPLTLFSQEDCYKKFKHRGDSALNKRNLEFAIRQFQAAKHCGLPYKKIYFLDSIIDATYRRWVKESEDAKIAAETASIKTLLEDANQLFLDKEFKALNEKIYSSAYKSRPAVTHYLNEIKPFTTDLVMNEIISLKTFSFNGNNFIAVIQRKINESLASKKKKITQTDLDIIVADEKPETVANRWFQFRILNSDSNS
jgi:hypothetical protein